MSGVDPEPTHPWPAALTIAGSDSGGGAGIQADLKTFAALGVFGTSAITAITAQNTLEVRQALHLPPELVVAQIMAVYDDIHPKAAKTGMLANDEIVRAVTAAIADLPDLTLVVDPVMFTSSGYQLLSDDAMESLRGGLAPLAALVTPNLREARAMTGIQIENDADMQRAAEAMLSMGIQATLIKGGHRTDSANDLYMDANQEHWFRAEHINTRHTHGTGCSLSAATAAGLALGLPMLEAITAAKEFVYGGLLHGYPVGAGTSPINHFHNAT